MNKRRDLRLRLDGLGLDQHLHQLIGDGNLVCFVVHHKHRERSCSLCLCCIGAAFEESDQWNDSVRFRDDGAI